MRRITSLGLGVSLLVNTATAGLPRGPETTDEIIDRKVRAAERKQEAKVGDPPPTGSQEKEAASRPTEPQLCKGKNCWDTPPSSPVRIVQLLEDCFAIRTDTEAGREFRRGCFAGATEKIQRGLRFQSCTWGTADAKFCRVPQEPHDYVGPEALQQRKTLKKKVKVLLRLLRAASAAPSGKRRSAQQLESETEKLIETLREVRRMTARLIFLERGTHSLVSQGGVSLGNWQAGYVYFATEVLKERQRRRVEKGGPRSKLSVFKTSVGASAGAINALAAAIEGCRTKRSAPHESLVFEVWVNTLGAFETTYSPGLFARKATPDPGSLFSKKPLTLAMNLAQQRIAQTASEVDGCALDYGFVTTHLKHLDTPVHVRVDNKQTRPSTYVTAPRLTERFPVRVSFRNGKTHLEALTPPKPHLLDAQSAVPENAFYSKLVPVECVEDRRNSTGHCEEQQSPDDPLDLYSFLKGVRASGAFPVAFPSAHLRYKLYDVEKQSYVVQTSEFVDGGTLDNRPIGLAVSLNRWWQDEQLKKSALPGGINPWLSDLVPATDTYFFLNPSVQSWAPGPEVAAPRKPLFQLPPSGRPLKGKPAAVNRAYRMAHRAAQRANAESKTGQRSLLQTHVGFAAELMNVSLDARLMATAEEHPFMRQEGGDQLLPQLVVPRRHLPITAEHLAHFMAFMERDFRIYDFVVGMADAREHLATLFPEETDAVHHWIKDKPHAGDDDSLHSRYGCLSEVYDHNLVRSPNRQDDGQLWGGVSCHEESKGNFESLVSAMLVYRKWTQGGHDPDRSLEVFVESLTANDYSYEDVPIKYLYGGFFGDLVLRGKVEAKILLRNILDDAVEQLSKKHTGMENVLVDTVGRAAADLGVRRYFPSFVSIGLASRGIELEVTDSFLARKWEFSPWFALRSDFRLRAHRLDRVSVQEGYQVSTVTTSAGYAARLVMGVPAFKPGVLDLELGGGPFLIGRWGMLQRDPLIDRTWGGAGSLAMVLMQRIYVMGDFEKYVKPERAITSAYLGTRLDESPVSSRVTLSAGLRFFWEPLEFLHPVKPRSRFREAPR